MMSRVQLIDGVARTMEVFDEILAENERLKAEIDDLRRQMLEARNQHLETERQHLETERQHLEAEVQAKPMEIHNHFESGSTSQVFNDQVSGRFPRTQIDKRQLNKTRNDIKKSKKKWKKTIRKIL